MKTIHVVSDVFKNLADYENIFTYSSAVDLINAATLTNTQLVIGQGIYEEQALNLQNSIDNLPAKSVTVMSHFDNYYRCDSTFTHKAKEFNTIISTPRKMQENQYESQLMIHEDCAELSDHVTGKHVQFMVLIEAARQMVNAVTEIYYSDKTKIYLANKLNITFAEFVYPFETKLVYAVKDSKIKVGGDGRMEVEIDFVQSGKTKCSVNFTFTILNRAFVENIETGSLKKEFSWNCGAQSCVK